MEDLSAKAKLPVKAAADSLAQLELDLMLALTSMLGQGLAE